MRHNPGLWNALWSDMWIETTFMRYGHSQGGIIGITLRPETLKTWALSLHICSQLERDVEKLSEERKEIVQMYHKEEMKSRIASDAKDRDRIRCKLQLLIDPMDPCSNPENIVNLATGLVLPEHVNVHNTLSIGTRQMKSFEEGWPSSFHSTIPKIVVTGATAKKHVNVDGTKVFDIGLIYSRVIGLQASSRPVDINQVLSHELSPVPTSMFTDSGNMRICKSKGSLKKTSSRNCFIKNSEL
jgi:hypothetical protein